MHIEVLYALIDPCTQQNSSFCGIRSWVYSEASHGSTVSETIHLRFMYQSTFTVFKYCMAFSSDLGLNFQVGLSFFACCLLVV